jgi:hypothetical protein
MKALLSSSYWPNLHYFYYLLKADEVWVDHFEYFEKQTYRNRCTILSANGPLDLSLPIHKSQAKEALHLVQLSDATRWRTQHWTAIASAYGKAPYFEYFADDLKSIYELPCDKLIDFNSAQLKLLLKLFRIKQHVQVTEKYESGLGFLDLRASIHPKKSYETDEQVQHLLSQPYYQSFSSKFSFQANLSVLDALLNKGLETITYLQQETASV